MDDTLARWRADTPSVLRGRIHLDNAGSALPPNPVLRAMVEHLELEARLGGYEAAEVRAGEVAATYEALAELLGVAGRNVALVENATVAVAQALSSVPFRPGDVLLTTRNDYASNQIMYLSLARRLGVRVLRAEDAPEGGVDAGSVAELLRAHRPRLVAVTWIPTNSGLVQPVEEVARLCREAEVPLLVDACQAVGQMRVDAGSLGCWFLAGTARKFLRGPRGIGFLCVSDEALAAGLHPLFPDMRGADWVSADDYALAADARRFENWEYAYALVLGLGAAVHYALEVDAGVARDRSWALARRARERLAEVGARVLDRGPALCAIATAALPGMAAADAVRALREQGIATSAIGRVSATIDMDEKGVASALRVSPHYYNTEAEVSALADVLAGLAGR